MVIVFFCTGLNGGPKRELQSTPCMQLSVASGWPPAFTWACRAPPYQVSGAHERPGMASQGRISTGSSSEVPLLHAVSAAGRLGSVQVVGRVLRQRRRYVLGK